MSDCGDEGPNFSTVGKLPYPEVYRNPDGTLVPRSGRRNVEVTNYPAETPIVTGCYVDDFTALQVGMFRILEKLTFTTIDRFKRIVDGTVAQNEMVFTRIFLDWPDSEDDLLPIPSVTIHAPEEVEDDSQGPLSGQVLLEETQDLYCEGTVLRRLYELRANLMVTGWLANKDDRGGVRRGLTEAFSEPGDDRLGRRIIIPEYFDRVARYDLLGIQYEDTIDFARSKQWPISARFLADIEAVALVPTPRHIREPRFNVGAT